MQRIVFTLMFLFSFLSLAAQDFEVVGVEPQLFDMSAREELKTDHKGRQCALLRVATQNITQEQREGFFFKTDYGSEIVERASRNGELWLWVSPGLKYLLIIHKELGQYELRTVDHVPSVESLHTYKITIRSTFYHPDQGQGEDKPNQEQEQEQGQGQLQEIAAPTTDSVQAPAVTPQIEVPRPTKSVFFVMANAAYSIAPQASFGLTVGSAKKLGWYASVNSNFRFEKAGYECDSNGIINGLDTEYSYSGEKHTSRLGATAGMVFRIYDPLYAYAGAGYGFRNVFWQLDNGSWAKCTDDSYQGIAMDAGIMLHFKGFGFSLGVQTIGVQYLEAKIGVGYTLKR